MDDYLSLLLEMQWQDQQDARQGFSLKDIPKFSAGGRKIDTAEALEESAEHAAEMFGQKGNSVKTEGKKAENSREDERTDGGLRWFLRGMEPVNGGSRFYAEQKNGGTGQEAGTEHHHGFFGTESRAPGSTLTPEALSMFFQRDARRYS